MLPLSLSLSRSLARLRSDRTSPRIHVLQGSWEEVLPKLPMHQFDVIFSDTWDTTRANGRQRFEYQEPWEINAYDAQIWSLYRVLRPQGAFVWYATGREYEGLAQFNVWCHAAWSSNLYS